MVYMGSQKSSGDHSLRVVFNEESHGGLRFSSFARRYTVINQTTRSTRHDPLGPPPSPKGGAGTPLRCA